MPGHAVGTMAFAAADDVALNSWLPSDRDIAAAEVSNRMPEVLMVSGDNPSTQVGIQQRSISRILFVA